MKAKSGISIHFSEDWINAKIAEGYASLQNKKETKLYAQKLYRSMLITKMRRKF